MALELNIKDSQGSVRATRNNNGTIILQTKNQMLDDNITVELVGSSDTSDATANRYDIVEGKTAYVADGSKVTGAIPSKSESDILNLNGSVQVPYGYFGSPVTVLTNRKDIIESRTLNSEAWEELSAGVCSQNVTFLNATTANTSVSVSMSQSMFVSMLSQNVSSIYIVNNGGQFTAYAIGARPTTDIVLQCALSETIS